MFTLRLRLRFPFNAEGKEIKHPHKLKTQS